MMKVIKGVAGLIGVMIFLAGIVVCMLETADLENQFMSLCVGFGMVCIGAVLGVIASRGDEDVLFMDR